MEKLTVELKTGDFDYPSENSIILSGGDPDNPTWDVYIAQFKKRIRKYLSKIRDYIVENNLIGKTGEWQNGKYFRFSDNFLITFTWRGWGDLMQAIVDKREGYVEYYM